MAIQFPQNPSNGDTTTINGVVYTYNSTKGSWDKTTTTVPPIVKGHVIPETSELYDLGSSTKKFRDLYLSSGTLYIGDASISEDQVLNVETTVTPENLEIQADFPFSGHGDKWRWTWEKTTLPFARTKITNAIQTTVPLYADSTYVINNYANEIHSDMTQTHQLYLKWIEGDGSDNLIDWVTYTTLSDSHPDINGGNPVNVQRLSFSVPSTITPPTLTAPTVTYDISATTGAWVHSGTQMGNNTSIGPVYRGGTYTFSLDGTTTSGHPFYLTTDNGTNYVTGSYVGEYTDGVTGSRNDSGNVTFVVPSDAPDTLYYQCGAHESMRGSITIKDLEVETNAVGNYIVYLQHSQEGHAQRVELRPLPELTSQMCLVYDATTGTWQPQDLSTYVDVTPSLQEKIKEVAGTATLVAPDGTSLVAGVEVYTDATYLPAAGNTNGDIAFAQDTKKLYIWKDTEWITAVADVDLTGYATETYVGTALATKVDSSSLATVATSGDYNDLTNLPTGSTVITGGNTPKATFSDTQPATIGAIGEMWFDTANGVSYVSVASGTVTGISSSDVDPANTTSWLGFSGALTANINYPYTNGGAHTITFNTPVWIELFNGEAGGNHHPIILTVYYEDGTTASGPPAPAYGGGHNIGSGDPLWTYGRITKLDLTTNQSAMGWSGKATLQLQGAPIWEEVLSGFSGSYNDLTDTPTIPSTAGLATETYVDNSIAALPSGGNVLEYTSTPASSTNDVVMLNSDGTVSPVEPTNYSATTFGTVNLTTTDAYQGNTGDGEENPVHRQVSYIPNDNDRMVVLWDSGNEGLKISVVDKSSGSLTFGPEYSASVASVSASLPGPWLLVDPFDGTKVYEFYRSSGNIYVRTGTISGVTITWGTGVDTGVTQSSALASFFYSYNESTEGNLIIYQHVDSDVRKLVWDGTTLTAGNLIDLGVTTSSYSGRGVQFNAGFPNIVSITYDNRSTQPVKLRVGIVDWDAETFTATYSAAIDAEAEFAEQFGPSNHALQVEHAHNPVNRTIVVHWRDSSYGGNSYLKTYAVSESGTVSSGSQIVFTSGSGTDSSGVYNMEFLPNSTYLVTAAQERYDSSRTYPYVRVINNVGTTVTYISRTLWGEYWYNSVDISVAQSDKNKGQYTVLGNEALPYQGRTAYYPRISMRQAPYSESNIDVDRLHGFATNSGTTVDVTLEGSIHSGLSGLSAGSVYYVLEDGSLSTTPDTNNARVGIALNSTSISVDFRDELTNADLGTYSTKSYVDTSINNLVNSAPDALNTLNELSAALGDDANFATTVTNSIATKASTSYVDTQLATKASVSDIPSQVINMFQEGELVLTTGTSRWYAPYGITINQIVIRLGTVADDTVGITINKNGTIANSYALPANSGGTLDTTNTISMVSGDYITVDVTSVGTTAKGEDLYVQLLYTKT
jgi:hypothetical protein